MRFQEPWTKGDLARAANGKGPFGALASLSTLATKIEGWAPSFVRALGFGGVPTSVGPGLASKAIAMSGVLNGPKTIFVSSNGRVISNMLGKR
uniref:Uncharacterized protein n=1 Tax=Panagrolaimus sp. ES5 TaxID=591445 RepID=A0AC34F7J8_9BILA